MTERDLMREISRTVTQQEQMMHALDRLAALVESLTKKVGVLEVKVVALQAEGTESKYQVH